MDHEMMLRIELCSDTIVGSGEGLGAVIDTDVMFDALGLPYLPGRRVRGILRESYMEVLEILQQAKLLELYGIQAADFSIDAHMAAVFGSFGQSESTPFRVADLRLEAYHRVADHVRYLTHHYDELFTQEIVRRHFTVIRQQTAIGDDGIADPRSLRTVRALKKGLVFEGAIAVPDPKDKDVLPMAFAVSNMRHMGTARTRGFGEISAQLLERIGERFEPVLSLRKGSLRWEVGHA